MVHQLLHAACSKQWQAGVAAAAGGPAPTTTPLGVSSTAYILPPLQCTSTYIYFAKKQKYYSNIETEKFLARNGKKTIYIYIYMHIYLYFCHALALASGPAREREIGAGPMQAKQSKACSPRQSHPGTAYKYCAYI
jgi:hypothetical protein